MKGTVYLIHFSQPVAHAKHYIGWAKGSTIDMLKRVQAHIDGKGSPLVLKASQIGELRIARTWVDVDRNFERRLKRGKDTPAFCPLCAGPIALHRRLANENE